MDCYYNNGEYFSVILRTYHVAVYRTQRGNAPVFHSEYGAIKIRVHYKHVRDNSCRRLSTNFEASLYARLANETSSNYFCFTFIHRNLHYNCIDTK